MAKTRLALFLTGVTCLLLSANAEVTVTEGTNLSVDVYAADGRIAFDLLGGLWIVDSRGGQATALPGIVPSASAPRWSPTGQQLIYESTYQGGNQLWLYDLDRQSTSALSQPRIADQDAAWHPDGDRIVFASAAENGRLDLWEQDLLTALRWRISDGPGDEFEPAWSADGKHLVYISKHNGISRLMLRRRSQHDVELYQSAGNLRAPSFRPDGSLVLFFAENYGRYTLQMAILSNPPLVRKYSTTETDLFLSRVSWQDRYRMLYAADGKILTRSFDDRRARPVFFRADVAHVQEKTSRNESQRTLPIVTPATDRLVIRAARLFDGMADQYRQNVDIIIDGGRIDSITEQRDDIDLTVIDLGDITVLPGFIDVYSALPATIEAGATVLAYGVTSIVSDAAARDFDAAAWHSAATPGPRLIPAGNLSSGEGIYLATLISGTPGESLATMLDSSTVERIALWQRRGVPVLADNWTLGLGLGVDLLMGAGALPTSPMGLQYHDLRTVASGGPITLVSALADANTPGLGELLMSRQATAFGQQRSAARRLAATNHVDAQNVSIVIGSKPNALPPGLSLHAEMLALAASGLDGRQIIRAASRGAAEQLRLSAQLGSVAPGLLADLVLVAGDPLRNVADAMNIVAVVRNGRFYSLSNLIDRAAVQDNVE